MGAFLCSRAGRPNACTAAASYSYSQAVGTRHRLVAPAPLASPPSAQGAPVAVSIELWLSSTENGRALPEAGTNAVEPRAREQAYLTWITCDGAPCRPPACRVRGAERGGHVEAEEARVYVPRWWKAPANGGPYRARAGAQGHAHAHVVPAERHQARHRC